MFKILKRTSRILALMVVYIMCAYGYMSAKGFVIKDGVPVLTNPVHAKEEFSKKVSGNIMMSSSLVRSKGRVDAPLTMYVFSSMACSHCRDFHNFILPKIERDFIETGKVRYVFVHMPLDAVSMRAAKLSYCLPPEKYDEFISTLYHKKDWFLSGKDEKLDEYALNLGLSQKGIKACNDNKKLTSDILMVRDSAIRDFNVSATPSFIIEGKDGKELISGAHAYNDFKDYINTRLAGN